MQAELRKIQTAVRKEEEKIERKQELARRAKWITDPSRRKHIIEMNEREVYMLRQKIASLKKKQEELLKEKERK